MTETTRTSRQGGLFVQTDGPGSKPLFAGDCVDAGDLNIPKEGVEFTKCWNADRDGYVIKARKRSEPGNSTIEIEELLPSERTVLEEADCPPILYLIQADCARPSKFENFTRMWIMMDAVITEETYTNIAHHVEDNDTTHSTSFEGDPNVIKLWNVKARRQSISETEALNDISGNTDLNCAGECENERTPGEYMGVCADSAIAPALADVSFTDDFGVTWTAGAANPGAAGENLLSIVRFDNGVNLHRWIVGKEAPVGAQGEIFYSDNDGTTWTTVNIGGVLDGHGVVNYGCIFALDSENIWLASAAGYIYYSDDAGVTWTAQEAGSITLSDYTHIWMYSENRGVAVSASGVVAITEDGGNIWTAGTVINGGAANNLTCSMSDENVIWVGDDAGALWRSENFATSWVQSTRFSNSGIGEVRDVHFINKLIGWMVSNSAAPLGTVYRTVNGGYDWQIVSSVPVNAGLNAILPVGNNRAFVVGEASGGTAVVLEINV